MNHSFSKMNKPEMKPAPQKARTTRGRAESSGTSHGRRNCYLPGAPCLSSPQIAERAHNGRTLDGPLFQQIWQDLSNLANLSGVVLGCIEADFASVCK